MGVRIGGGLNQGCTDFLKIWEARKNSRHQGGDLKDDPY
jgi:hypothetical protein